MDDRIITDQKPETKQTAPGIGGILLTIFVCVLIPVLSFYAPDGYQELGNRKFEAWRIIAVAFALPLLVITVIRWFRSLRPAEDAREAEPKRRDGGHIRAVDLFVILYGVFLTVSFLLSYDRAESLWGTTGWRMGYLTEILFLLYYMFARIYPIRFRVVVPIALISGGGVILTAILERVGIYPFSWQLPDATFVSTIGNVDWYCGYLAMFMSLTAALCLGGRVRERICGAVLFAAGVCSAVILGANTGILLLISFLPALLLVIGDRDRYGRLFRALAILLLLGLIGAYIGMLLAFHPAVWLPDRWYRFFTAGFGNGRGAIWRYAYEMHGRLPLWRRFVGVGPDAFARFSYDDPQLLAFLTESFGMARLTNAHSELITMILDEGILTAVCYLLLLLSALIRIVRYHGGLADTAGSQAAREAAETGREAGFTLTSIAIFAMVSLSVVQAVNFRTISATPFLFLLIGAAVRETETDPARDQAPAGQDGKDEEEE